MEIVRVLVRVIAIDSLRPIESPIAKNEHGCAEHER